MKKVIHALIFLLVVVSGLVFANREIKNKTSTTSIPMPIPAAEREAAMKEWEATSAGIMFKKWEASPAGRKVYAAEDKIRKHVKDSSNMEAVVTSLSVPPGSRLGFGMMVKINGEEYILAFGIESSEKSFLNLYNEFEQLHSLEINDKIIIRSQNVSHAPKYAYPIISGDYVERDGKIIFKRVPRKEGC